MDNRPPWYDILEINHEVNKIRERAGEKGSSCHRMVLDINNHLSLRLPWLLMKAYILFHFLGYGNWRGLYVITSDKGGWWQRGGKCSIQGGCWLTRLPTVRRGNGQPCGSRDILETCHLTPDENPGSVPVLHNSTIVEQGWTGVAHGYVQPQSLATDAD